MERTSLRKYTMTCKDSRQFKHFNFNSFRLARILISLSIIARETLFKMLQKCVSVYVCSYVCISKSELITLFIRCAFEAKFLPLAHAYNINQMWKFKH